MSFTELINNLKPGDTIMAGGYDWSWCYVWFKDIPNHQGYIASSLGDIFSSVKSRGREYRKLSPGLTKCHLTVAVINSNGVRYSVQVGNLILGTFWGEKPEGCEVHHYITNDARDNRLANLRYGPRPRKIEKSDIPDILRMRKEGMQYKDIACIYKVTPSCIGIICRRNS